MFEGIGVVMPLMEVTAEPKKFSKIVMACIATLTTLFISFGSICYLTYGGNIKAIVTENLPATAPMTIFVKIVFCVNVFFTFPVIIAPANRIIESWIFQNQGFSLGLRYWLENISRCLICVILGLMAYFIADDLDKFLGLIGAVCCAPLVITIPVCMHLRVLAKTPWDLI